MLIFVFTPNIMLIFFFTFQFQYVQPNSAHTLTHFPPQMDTIAAAFGEIAAGCAAMDGMVNIFGQEISKMVATRICLDHM